MTSRHLLLTLLAAKLALLNPQQKPYLVAYSGGLDSHVLLHALAHLKQQNPSINLRAMHINHGLQNIANDWEQHCQAICEALDIPYVQQRLALKPATGESIEALARKQRYFALATNLQPNELLVTAQHQDDQAETLLLQLLRGAGSKGLAAMPESKAFAHSHHVRPLLKIPKSVLLDYAQTFALDYIEDPSNQDHQFDRNFLRHQVMTPLKARWPSMSATLSRAAAIQAETSQLLDGYIDQQYQAIQQQTQAKDLSPFIQDQNTTLAVKALRDLPYAQQKALIRHWIRLNAYPTPSEKKLKQLIQDMLYAGSDRQPVLTWHKTEVRRHHDYLYIMPPYLANMIDKPIIWQDMTKPLPLANLGITLSPDILSPYLSAIEQFNLTLSVSNRYTNDVENKSQREPIKSNKIKLSLNSPSMSLKHFFQEKNIPAWERNQIPLIYANEHLIVIYRLANIDIHVLSRYYQ